jgi:hypothetical protein
MQPSEPRRIELPPHAAPRVLVVVGEHDVHAARRACVVTRDRLRVAIHRRSTSRVKIMSRVLDRIHCEDGVIGAARVLLAWRAAGGLETAERGAADLRDLCALAETAVRAHERLGYLHRVVRAA